MRVSKEGVAYPAMRSSAVWNGRKPDRFPDEIAQPRTADSVREVVRQAIRDDQTIAVKSGGHDYHGACLRDGGILVDLGKMDGISIDAEKAEAWVEPGATNRSLTRYATPARFAFPTGHHPGVGLGGYLLGGGLGWNPTGWGPACWSVRAIQAVTVDGTLIDADDENNPELLWAARGGAAGFPAIVTRFRLDLKRLPCVLSQVLTFRLQSLPSLLTWMGTVRIPGVEISVIVRASDEHVGGGEPTARAVLTYFGSTAKEARELATMVAESPSVPDKVIQESKPREIAFEELEGEGSLVEGRRYSVDGGWFDSDPGEIGEICATALAESPSDLTRFVFARGQFPSPTPDVAFSILGSMTAHAYATWEKPEDDAVNIEWVRDLMCDLDSHVSGFWPAQSNLQAAEGRTRNSYTPEKWEQLSRIRDHYDPGGRKFGFLE